MNTLPYCSPNPTYVYAIFAGVVPQCSVCRLCSAQTLRALCFGVLVQAALCLDTETLLACRPLRYVCEERLALAVLRRRDGGTHQRGDGADRVWLAAGALLLPVLRVFVTPAWASACTECALAAGVCCGCWQVMSADESLGEVQHCCLLHIGILERVERGLRPRLEPSTGNCRILSAQPVRTCCLCLCSTRLF